MTINTITQKKYIGKDSSNSPYYLGSGTLIKKAIKQYGRKNFKKIILEECTDKISLAQREEYWLNYFQVESNPEFYNQTNKAFGNSGQSHETKKKISMAKKGTKLSEETKKRMSEARKNHPMYTDEWKQKISEALKGKEVSNTTRKKQAASAKGNKNRRKSVNQYDLKGNFIKKWDSVKEASEFLGKHPAAITEVCNGKRKSCYNYLWKYN